MGKFRKTTDFRAGRGRLARLYFLLREKNRVRRGGGRAFPAGRPARGRRELRTRAPGRGPDPRPRASPRPAGVPGRLLRSLWKELAQAESSFPIKPR